MFAAECLLRASAYASSAAAALAYVQDARRWQRFAYTMISHVSCELFGVAPPPSSSVTSHQYCYNVDALHSSHRLLAWRITVAMWLVRAKLQLDSSTTTAQPSEGHLVCGAVYYFQAHRLLEKLAVLAPCTDVRYVGATNREVARCLHNTWLVLETIIAPASVPGESGERLAYCAEQAGLRVAVLRTRLAAFKQAVGAGLGGSHHTVARAAEQDTALRQLSAAVEAARHDNERLYGAKHVPYRLTLRITTLAPIASKTPPCFVNASSPNDDEVLIMLHVPHVSDMNSNKAWKRVAIAGA